MMSNSRILAAFAAALPLGPAGIGFLALDGLGAAEAAGPAEAPAVEIVQAAPDACSRATWPMIPAECLDGTDGDLRRVTVLTAF